MCRALQEEDGVVMSRGAGECGAGGLRLACLDEACTEGRWMRVGRPAYTLRSDEKKAGNLTVREGQELGTLAVTVLSACGTEHRATVSPRTLDRSFQVVAWGGYKC